MSKVIKLSQPLMLFKFMGKGMTAYGDYRYRLGKRSVAPLEMAKPELCSASMLHAYTSPWIAALCHTAAWHTGSSMNQCYLCAGEGLFREDFSKAGVTELTPLKRIAAPELTIAQLDRLFCALMIKIIATDGASSRRFARQAALRVLADTLERRRSDMLTPCDVSNALAKVEECSGLGFRHASILRRYNAVARRNKHGKAACIMRVLESRYASVLQVEGVVSELGAYPGWSDFVEYFEKKTKKMAKLGN